jgi:hypothetical protein
LAAGDRLAVHAENLGRDPEGLVRWQTEDLLGRPHLIVTQGRPVCLRRVGELRGGVPDVAAKNKETGSVLHGHGPPQSGLERVGVVGHLAQALDVPPVGLEAFGRIVVQGDLGGAVDGDVIIVVDVDQAAESEMARDRGGLVAYALHQIAVAAQHERVVIHQVGTESRAEEPFRHAEADTVGNALAERAGGDLDAREVVHFGVARRAAAELAEPLQVLELDPVTSQVEH